MQLHISTQSGEPLYRQIISQVKFLVASGRLSEGDELPAIRVLAEQLLINPNTVARAYRELETEGLLTKRQGAGTYVSGNGSPLARRERMRIIKERVEALMTDARNLNIPVDDVIGMVQDGHERLSSGEEEDER